MGLFISLCICFAIVAACSNPAGSDGGGGDVYVAGYALESGITVAKLWINKAAE